MYHKIIPARTLRRSRQTSKGSNPLDGAGDAGVWGFYQGERRVELRDSMWEIFPRRTGAVAGKDLKQVPGVSESASRRKEPDARLGPRTELRDDFWEKHDKLS